MVVLAMMVLCLLAGPAVAEGEGLKEVERGLLALLGLPRRPPPNNRAPDVPQAMLQLYDRQARLDIHTSALPLPGSLVNSANTARSFYHIEPERRSGRRKREERARLVFNVSLPEGERVTGAEVRLEGLGAGRVWVHDIVRPGAAGAGGPLLRVVDAAEAKGEGGGVALDVLPAVERWAREPGHNHGLLLEVERGRAARSWSAAPLLIVYSDDGRNRPPTLEALLSRPKRAAAHHHQPKKRWKEAGRDHCRRHPLYVDFADVGWNDWIVAPPGYDAYYCHGDCPFPLSDHMNSTNHAVIQNLVHNVNRGAVPKACCVPTQLSSISMLYLDEGGKVVLKTYQDMAVVGCGCR